MVINGYKWLSMVINANFCYYVINDYQRFLVIINDYQWLSMLISFIINDYQWFLVIINDYQWL